MAAMSPASSPRLPSPPPIAEDQLGPKSPISEERSIEAKVDRGSARRIRPGTKAHDMAHGPPLSDLNDIESAFQLMEYLKALHHAATHPTGSNVLRPLDHATAKRLSEPPPGVDRALWLYELCRFLTEHANSILIALFADNPPCSAQTCPEMRASEWQYLCAVHDPPKSCCAIDYCCHTLDWAANTLTSAKNFPSRLALGTEASTAPQQIRQLTNVFRRVYRIFAHAWFQHRDMFWKVENRTGLYSFFKVVCDSYNLIPPDNYTIPPAAQGIEPPLPEPAQPAPRILAREDRRSGSSGEFDPTGVSHLVAGNTTKRHRHTPPTSARQIGVIEEKEEEDLALAKAVGQVAETPAEEYQPEQEASDRDAHAANEAEPNGIGASEGFEPAHRQDELPAVDDAPISPEEEPGEASEKVEPLTQVSWSKSQVDVVTEDDVEFERRGGENPGEESGLDSEAHDEMDMQSSESPSDTMPELTGPGVDATIEEAVATKTAAE